MEKSLRDRLLFILNEVQQNGLKWKIGKSERHLEKRKKKGHIPQDFTVINYENVIISIINNYENDVYLYYLKGYEQDYFVFGNGSWIVIIGENSVMATAFQIDRDYTEYLSKENGYSYLGKVKEVLQGGE